MSKDRTNTEESDPLSDLRITRNRRLMILLFTTAVFGYFCVVNSWLCDDAFITFRVIDNLIEGYGAVWNIDERVQVYTHPAWLFILGGLSLITGDLYFTVLGLSFLFSLTAVLLLMNGFADNPPKALLLFLILISSKSFMDYTSSGLENPLSYLIVALFYPWYITTNWGEGPLERSAFLGSLTLSLGYLVRPDLSVLFVVPWVHIVAMAQRGKAPNLLTHVIIGLMPAFIWTLFSLVYYGFVFPNSYYAKIACDVSLSIRIPQGLRYVWVCWLFDPLTLIALTLAFILALFMNNRIEVKIAGVSTLLYLAYIVSVGGDFMAGRFFSVPLLIAAFLLVSMISFNKRVLWTIPLLSLVAYNVIMPFVPIKSRETAGWKNEDYYGVCDERGFYSQQLSLRSILLAGGKIEHGWAERGRLIKKSNYKVAYVNSVGLTGFYSSPKLVIGWYGVVDPLLARLPVPEGQKQAFRPGHLVRQVPEGYLNSRARGDNLIKDAKLHKYYDEIKLLTSGPLLSSDRLHAIYDMNFGSGRRFDKSYR